MTIMFDSLFKVLEIRNCSVVRKKTKWLADKWVINKPVRWPVIDWIGTRFFGVYYCFTCVKLSRRSLLRITLICSCPSSEIITKGSHKHAWEYVRFFNKRTEDHRQIHCLQAYAHLFCACDNLFNVALYHTTYTNLTCDTQIKYILIDWVIDWWQ